MPADLCGRTVVLTRRTEDNAALADLLRTRGADVIDLPCVRTESLDDQTELAGALARLTAADVLVLTSRAGVDAVADALPREGIASAVAAVGPATAARALSIGLHVVFAPTGHDSRSLAAELPLPRGEIVLARSELADDELPALLRGRGAAVREVVAYRTVLGVSGDVAPIRSALDRGRVTIVVASPSALAALVAALGAAHLRRASFVTFGERTARAVRERVGARAVIAASDANALSRAIAPAREEVVS